MASDHNLPGGSSPAPAAEFDARERRNWSGLAQRYGQTYARVCAGSVSSLTESAQVRPGHRVLDVGTGTGEVAAALVRAGASVTGVDADAAGRPKIRRGLTTRCDLIGLWRLC
jgi:cyclopropane fatty-acyl-phospholipid synthase-like methyltransferase